MASLRGTESFVGERRVADHRKNRASGRYKLAMFVLGILITGWILSAFTSFHSWGYNGYNGAFSRVVNNDFGSGYKNPQVISASPYFVVGTVNYGVLKITYVNSADGSIQGSSIVAKDVNGYYFRLDYDPQTDKIVVLWVNSSGLLNYTFIAGISTGTPVPERVNITIVTNAGSTNIGISSNRTGGFMAVWSDTSYHNYYSMINAEDESHSTPQLVSSDTHSHAQNYVAFDAQSRRYMIVWRNLSGISGYYNITARIFNSQGIPLTGDITIADGVAAGTRYDYPSVDGGGGYFAVAYVNYNSPYDMHMVILDSSGVIHASVDLGNTAKYGKSYIGLAYNGSGFVVAWTDSNYDIVANNYDFDGNPAFAEPRVIAGTGDSEEWQDVAYDSAASEYYFVWYDYTSKDNLGALWTESEYIPEISPMVFLGLFLPAVIWSIKVWRRY